MDREQALQIFKEYSSIFTVVEDDDVDRVYLVDNFDRHGISDYVYKIEHYQTGKMHWLVPYKVKYFRDREMFAGGRIRCEQLINLPELDESRLRKLIRGTILEYSRLKLNLRRNIVEGL